ncbi:hypothetical protein F5B22DRAFT_662251 [Xylaria bambusicola]|uniref:uncharacterized protein n=1 Tax=Xylaria bambusicola TaxID=326684 RepID=UPI0020075843|nr:uncharacterized protein F5B22DRAFT_662251 [Xylaria bambusicola]KAI0503234.1 hypothetical protein F5B22DRAFT_662251 [Xylaria bambusicola]
MAVPLRTIFTEAPIPLARFFDPPGASSRSISQKSWASTYSEISMPLFQFFDLDQIQGLLGPEDELDRLLLAKTAYPHNPAAEALQSEADKQKPCLTTTPYHNHPPCLLITQLLKRFS